MQKLTEQETLFLQMIALSGMKTLAKERTLQALYHILRGRKANQTLQDVHLFRLYPYYRLFPQFSKEKWEEIVHFFVREKLIEETRLDQNKNSFMLTAAGEDFCRSKWKDHQMDEWFAVFVQQPWVTSHLTHFWLRIHLMVQTISHLLAGDPAFYPLVQDRPIQLHIKQLLHRREYRERWKSELADELYRLLRKLPEEVQQLLVKQWAGRGETAITIQQLAYQQKLAPSFVLVKWRYGVARMMIELREKADEYPLLSMLLPEKDHEALQRMNKSARETYRLLQTNLTLDEIARRRGITRNTVEDHVVDIALHMPHWDVSRFLSPQERQQIVEVSRALQTHRLRLIKEKLHDRYSYLQIRLALAIGEDVT